ncbi:40S ribosomal protein S10B (nucleomorph) [Chroomonas mesostigmatica CCMP1168]|uniref:40S ribosomal protein S10B n=1 Tax=Chroomonas mesostigmatica CCMP1168 TaxID=1195612 RepID=J7G1S9_9CRYP|nr:40S ribosomal protein S10B [Chroomonas mesostigmatica CCMP1168]|mmetsp:Transcript_66762/g.164533  ORF Transcript_66762/g.164533 Transcript_66762/m.164533 type:complete len:96 (-) Transcript_66762:4682-4969(-)
MIITKQHKKIILTQIFKDGVLVIKKEKNVFDTNEKKIKNIAIIKLMKSLVSKGLITERFCWKFYYFILNDKGIKFLRKYLYIPENVVPLTLPFGN